MGWLALWYLILSLPLSCYLGVSIEKLTLYTAAESPTGADSSYVEVVPDSEPWKNGQDTALNGKYKYHPYNDVTRPVKESPTALNVVVIPDVTLPKVRAKKT
jgi:hypothetical protein